jgi:WD40 repeat protein
MAITLNINDNKKNNTNKKIVGIFPLEKEGIKVLFSDFSGIDFKKEKIKENVFKYIKIDFFYSHGLILNDNLIGNSKLDLEQIPFCLYNNGQYLIEGGFINGEMVISDLINAKGYLLFNDYDHSPVIEIKINNEETIGIAGTLLGIIYIYKIKDYFWDYKIKINIHNQKINNIFISDELNAFVSCSDDNYINIFSFPSCKVINSLFVEKPEIVLLSSRPLNICITYSSKNQKLIIFSVNGHLVKEMKQDKKPEYPTIYTNKYFRDYLIFVNNGNICIFSLPYLEIINKIQLIDEKIYKEFDLFLKYYQNKNKNIENLIACDRIRQIIYIIGDN